MPYILFAGLILYAATADAAMPFAMPPPLCYAAASAIHDMLLIAAVF